MTPPAGRQPASWFALNAYGVLVGALEVVTGIAGMANPARLIVAYGYVPALAYVWLALYTVAGAMLLFALWRSRVDIEVYSLVFLVAANVLSLSTAVSEIGARAVARDFLISAVLAWTLIMRCRALLRGGTFVVPVWRRRVRR